MRKAETLKQKIRSTEGLIAELAETDEAVGCLSILPGIGEFFSVLICHEGRARWSGSRAPRRFVSYTGLIYQRLNPRREARDVRTTTVRKLAELAWTLCTEKRPYEERWKERAL